MPAQDQREFPPNPALKEALDRMGPVLKSMPPSEVVQAALDPTRAAGVVVGSLLRIEEHRPAMEAQFGKSAIACLEELPIIADATKQADIELAAACAENNLSERFAQVAADHELLLTDANALANRRLLDRARVDAGRPRQGYRPTSKSTLVLVALMRERWDDVKDRTPLTLEELAAIEARAQAMLKRLDEREQGSTRIPAARLRTRALSRLIRTYGEVRRMLTYVRWWEDDADAIAPSLWARRRKGCRVVEEVVARSASPVLPGAPAAGSARPASSRRVSSRSRLSRRG